ncbi:MAG: glutamine-hydrolyzing carbamoyl-phosphate synthase small subunit [Hydrogenophilus sp.]|nr:glutamine-hydrolyzing carbamoyl-phosphate synthase small subunit [Hydrogenophilus sp.]
MSRRALLALADGTIFWGVAIGAPGLAVGEVVFNTSITGYQEILTDPSYRRQIVTLTAPQIGNVGVNGEDWESSAVHAAGLVVREASRIASNFRADEELSSYLIRQGVVAIGEVDTRALTRRLRDGGAQAGAILSAAHSGELLDPAVAIEAARAFPGLAGMDLAQEVSCKEPHQWEEGVWRLGVGFERSTAERERHHVVVYDFGVKRNILRHLVTRGCRVTVIPATTPYERVKELAPDGILLSNGPGDPEPCAYAIEATRAAIVDGVPIFGICLGHQILGLASGGRTVKMKFGHHGANHPVKELATGRVFITSQNHGFAVDGDSLPSVCRVTHISLFDGSVQGIERTDAPAFGFQGHPEASPGPHDIAELFDRFVALMDARRQ